MLLGETVIELESLWESARAESDVELAMEKQAELAGDGEGVGNTVNNF
jgi:hypothetical protein